VSGTRLAFRLARREVRRRPLRAALVVLLVVIPVFALTVADVLIESGYTKNPEQQFVRTFGPADYVYNDTLTNATVAPAGTPVFTPPLPAGSRAVAYRFGNLPLTPRVGIRAPDVQVTDAGAAGLTLTGARLVEGRGPRAGEVALSSVLATAFGVGIGDRLELVRPVFSARVVGITESPADDRRALLDAPTFPFDAVVLPGTLSFRVPVVLPADASLVMIRPDGGFERYRIVTPSGRRPVPAVSVRPGAIPTREVLAPDYLNETRTIDPQAKFWSWVGVALLLAMIAVIIAAAFATTARRQLVVLGQLAANGGRPAFLRRTLTLQGTLLGVIGAAVGVGAGLLGLRVAHGWIEGLYHHDVDYLVTWDLAAIALTAVVAATLAARFPAYSVSRIPVLSALAGRRPLAPVPRLAWLKAVIVFVTGVALLLLVVLGSDGSPAQLGAVVAILGGLFVMAGAAMLTPSVVTLIARWGSRLGVSARLGTRSLVRVRSRSAAIVTAVAIAGAVAVAVVTGMLGLGINRTGLSIAGLPDNVVIGSAASGAVVDGVPQAADAGTLLRGAQALRTVVPGIDVSPTRQVATQVTTAGGTQTVLADVSDPVLVRALGLSPAERAELSRRGAVLTDGFFADGRGAVVEISGPAGSERLDVRRRAANTSVLTLSGSGLLVAPEVLARTGAPAAATGLLGVAPSAISSTAAAALDQGFVGAPDPYAPPVGASSSTDMTFRTGQQIPAFWRGIWSPVRIQFWFALGALAFVLLVVAIGLLLGRAEARDEREVLDALGARPRTERRIAAVQAAALALGGGLIAVVAGWLPMAAVFKAVQEERYVGVLSSANREAKALYPFIRFPWGTAVGLAVLIPLIAAIGAWTATALAQRTRVLRASTFGAD
jgi:putative ABC transport system permease protein